MTEPLRIVFCATCGARYEVPGRHLDEPRVLLLCGSCGEASAAGAAAGPTAVAEGATAWSGEREDLLTDAKRPRVIVGHDVPSAARSVAQVLRAAGYAPTCVRSGVQVLAACDPSMPTLPAAVVLDVAIPDVLAFEVIGQLRASPATAELPVVLLASVFERTRYKRRPTNLHGANTYLELHHVPDRLPAILDEIRSKQVPVTAGPQTPNERARAASMRARPDAVDRDAARVLARRLLSDVALYHGDELAAGIRAGQPFMRLAPSIEAAREMFVSARADPAVFDGEVESFAARLMQQHGGRGRDG